MRDITADELMQIARENDGDFSGKTVDADPTEIFEPESGARFRAAWAAKEHRNQRESEARRIEGMEAPESGFLTEDSDPTYAGLILTGTTKALGKHLRQAEIIFEYRTSEGAIAYAQRVSETRGFLASGDNIWTLINKRNEARLYQEGLFRYSVRSFDEPTIREALCNAVCHRDYLDQGPIFVREYPELLEAESPGASVVPIEDMITRSKPRNRLLAEAMERCGLVERSGQGVDLMYEQCVRNSRALPDWSALDSARVVVKARGEVTDAKIISFFERMNAETLKQFSGEDFLIDDLVRRKEPLPSSLRERAAGLVRLDVLERSGPGFRLPRAAVAIVVGAAGEAGASNRGSSMLVPSMVRAGRRHFGSRLMRRLDARATKSAACLRRTSRLAWW